MLARSAALAGERGVGMLDGRGRPLEWHTQAALQERWRAAAARLVAAGVEPREPVPIALSTSSEWLDAWFGALLAGAWPVALSPPTGLMGTADYALQRLDAIVESLGARRLICPASTRDEARKQDLALARLAVTSDELAALAPVSHFETPRVDPEETAFLQLTSGSTGIPRAVMISHRAVVSNVFAIADGIGARHDVSATDWPSTCIGWLPLHHDMGLVGCLLTSLANRYSLWLLQARSFLARPDSWLRALAAHPATLAPAPCFAYQMCIERVGPERLEGANLGVWRAALVGAEMVRPEVLSEFAAKFEPAGFRPESFHPCYGLSEGTLAVTLSRSGGLATRTLPPELTASEEPLEIASAGPPVADTTVEVRAPDGRALSDGQIGEVFVQGPGVFSGYYQAPDETAAALQDGWLRTGDLGLMADGELWITGRVKDLIIVNGQNMMPHELEWLAEAASGGGGARRAGAFSVDGPSGEAPVLIVEVQGRGPDDMAATEREIRTRVGRDLGLQLADVVFVRRGAIPKTTSGKVQRRELRARYLSGEIERVER